MLPQLGGQDEDRALLRGQADVREAVGFLADPVPRGGRVIRAPALVRHRLDVEAELAELALVPFEHPAEGDVVAGGVVVDLLAQFAAAQAVLGVEQGDEQVQEAFSTGGGHLARLLMPPGKARKRGNSRKELSDCYRAFGSAGSPR